MMKILIVIMGFLSLWSCQSDSIKEREQFLNLEEEVQSLVNDSLKNIFLFKIWDDDQNPRRLDLVVNEQRNIKEMDSLYQLNLKRVDLYLNYWGYPEPTIFGEIPGSAPITVVHHAPDIPTREKYFPVFYKAFKEGKIRGTGFTFYLQRWHKMKFGKRVEFDRPFTEEEELEQLYKNLGLDIFTLNMQYGFD